MFKKKLIYCSVFLAVSSHAIANNDIANKIKLKNSYTTANGEIVVKGGSGNDIPENKPVISSSGQIPVNNVKMPASIKMPEEKTEDFKNPNSIDIPNSSKNSDGTITVRGGADNTIKNNNNGGKSVKMGGTTVTIGAPTSSNQSKESKRIALEKLQKQIASGEVPEGTSVIQYQGGTNNAPRVNNANNGSVLEFKGELNNIPQQPSRPNRDNVDYSNTPNIPSGANGLSMPLPSLPVIANGMPTPNAEALPLPPLPGMGLNDKLPPLPNMTGVIGILPSSISTNLGDPNGPPVNYQGRSISVPDSSSPDDKLENKWANLMQEQANILMDSGIPLKIAIIETNNLLLRRFVVQGMLKNDESRLSKTDMGMYPVMSQSFINGKITPTCYILFDRKNLSAFNKQILTPFSKKIGDKGTAAYLTGHQVAHCLDQFERSKVIPTKRYWFPNDLAKYGVNPSSIRRIFSSNGVTPEDYFKQQTALFDDLGQRQYEERVADSFGVLWTLSKGYSTNIVDEIIRLRKNQNSESPHDTKVAVLKAVGDYKLSKTTNLSQLWKMSRSVQISVGVNNSLGNAAKNVSVKENSNEELKGNPEVKPSKLIQVGKDESKVRLFGDSKKSNEINSPKFNELKKSTDMDNKFLKPFQKPN